VLRGVATADELMLEVPHGPPDQEGTL
jgi:hypothetical protein